MKKYILKFMLITCVFAVMFNTCILKVLATDEAESTGDPVTITATTPSTVQITANTNTTTTISANENTTNTAIIPTTENSEATPTTISANENSNTNTATPENEVENTANEVKNEIVVNNTVNSVNNANVNNVAKNSDLPDTGADTTLTKLILGFIAISLYFFVRIYKIDKKR